MNKELRFAIFLISSIIQIIMKAYFPVVGGGTSLVLVFSIPILIGLGIMFALVDYYFIIKINNQIIRNLLFLLLEFILLGLAIWSYPFA